MANILKWMKVLLSACGIAFIFYTVFRDYFVNDPLTLLGLVAVNPYFAFAYQFFNSQNMLVAVLTILIIFVIIVIWNVDRKKKTPNIIS